MKNITTLIITLSLSTLLFSCQEKKVEEKTKRPNIIYIMSDDHAYQAISAYDTSLIHTPNIDRLAHEGMRFDHAYVSNSICSPSRAVTLTGKMSHFNSVKDNLDVFDSTQITYPKILQNAGYETAIVGKWHLKSQPTGFDYWEVLPDQGDYYQPDFRTPNGMINEKGYVTDIITDKAIAYLDKRKKNEEPFMLMVHHKAPHREWMVAMEHLQAFKDQKIKQPATLFDDYKGRGKAAQEAEMRISDHMGLTNDTKVEPEIRDAKGFKPFMGWYDFAYSKNLKRMTAEEKAKWEEVYGPINEDFKNSDLKGKELTAWKYQRYMEDYLGTLVSVDENVGRLLDYLDQTGLAENTIVVYTSDQGFYLGEHGWFDKRFMYEQSFRTPLMVRWPGHIKAGSVNKDLVQNIDYAPSFLEAAGVEIPTDMQGASLLPLMEQKKTDWRDALYYHYYEYPGIHGVKRHYGIKTKRYKLIHFYYDVDEWELYDLEKDPDEMQNVYTDPSYAEVKETLHQKLKDLRKQYGDSDQLTQEMLKADLKRLEELGLN
ncbi:sulfatase family protein [Flammeovirga aprica]|uniref:Sulfatase n=1 Tax=Flammeovirga aprica JL-4 TaxID=694437 RepID=A0A7X9RUC8_9BACT|nr:sulfatase [Flammeovirga aprica]NME68869.1 sulfatase [Flammeovirga aprica JL-4]